jgi:hypothetical protein
MRLALEARAGRRALDHPPRTSCLWRLGAGVGSYPRGFRVKVSRTVTSGLNFTQNHRFEFAVAAAAGAVD